VIPIVYFRDSDGDNTVAEFIASFKFFPLGLRSVPAEKKVGLKKDKQDRRCILDVLAKKTVVCGQKIKQKLAKNVIKCQKNVIKSLIFAKIN
jgi:hypothetical protein